MPLTPRRYTTALEIWMRKHGGPLYRGYSWRALLKDGAKGCADTEYGRALVPKMMESCTRGDYCALAGQGYRMLAEAMEAALPHPIDCPALLMCGEYERAGSAKRYNRAWTKGERLPLVWIPDAVHHSNTDNP